MFGKFFSSTFTGSMFGAGCEVFAVWGYVIANTVDSQIELNPKMLAAALGADEKSVIAAIDYLCQPDPHSRSKIADGRRLVREGQFAYRVPNYLAYRSIANEDDRREYNRVKKQEQRDRDSKKSNDVKTPVKDGQLKSAMSAQAETEAETEAEAIRTPPQPPRVESPTDVRKRADFGKYLIDHSISIDDPEYDRKTFDLIRRSALRSGMSYTEAKEILGKDAKWRKWKWFDLIDSQETIEFPETPAANVSLPENNKHGITVQMAAQAFMLDAGLNNPKTYVIVENCIGSYLRHNPGSNPIAAKESIQALWKEYKESNIHAKCSVTTWLGDSSNFLKPETWRPKPKEPEKAKPQNGFKPASKTPEWAFRKPE